mmetsp:Transcript_52154/g.91665  ORF Transcript_52154/g.91665 Transcript_52154/m.91665 type:complete len:417 (+) Transcript_52154:43-1293(+)
MLTKELLANLCNKLHHEDAHTVLVKKLVGENWLEKAEDLKHVPRQQLERWDIPLKLVDEIFDLLNEREADSILSGLSAWVNYTMRPNLERWTGVTSSIEALRSDAEKRREPRLWAVKRLQRSFRRRQAKEHRERDERLMREALDDAHDKDDFCRLSDKASHARRKRRAEEKIARAVRVWVERLRATKRVQQRGSRSKGKGLESRSEASSLSSGSALSKGGYPGGANLIHVSTSLLKSPTEGKASITSVSGQTDLRAALMRLSKGEVRRCPVEGLVRQIGRIMQREERDMTPYLHRLVTQNWLEDLEDLDLVEDHHWEAWDMPEKLVILMKQELAEHRGQNRSQRWDEVKSSVSLSTAAAAVGDWTTGVTEAMAWGAGWLTGEAGDDEDALQGDGKRESTKSVATSDASSSLQTRRL